LGHARRIDKLCIATERTIYALQRWMLCLTT
jgi:hypothetical protein